MTEQGKAGEKIRGGGGGGKYPLINDDPTPHLSVVAMVREMSLNHDLYFDLKSHLCFSNIKIILGRQRLKT